MEQVFSAELLNNKLTWLDELPQSIDKRKKYKVKVYIEPKEKNRMSGRELVEAFRNSPLFGVELDLERDKDTGRDIEL